MTVPEIAPGAVMLVTTVAELLTEFEGRAREILVLFLQGYTAPEVSSQIGCTERTVYRTYERVKEWLRCRANA